MGSRVEQHRAGRGDWIRVCSPDGRSVEGLIEDVDANGIGVVSYRDCGDPLRRRIVFEPGAAITKATGPADAGEG